MFKWLKKKAKPKTPAEKYMEEYEKRPWVSIPEIFEWCNHLDEISEAKLKLLKDILL